MGENRAKIGKKNHKKVLFSGFAFSVSCYGQSVEIAGPPKTIVIHH